MAVIAAAAAAFTALCMNASAVTVQLHGRLPARSPNRAYDILVRAPSRVAGQPDDVYLARPTDLAELSGGITLAQYETISKLAGVQVAAPMTLVGYVPLTVVIPVALPASALTSTPALFTVTARQQTDGGLSTATDLNIGSTYVTTSPLSVSAGAAGTQAGDVEAAPDGAQTLVCPRASATPLPQVFSADAQRRTACWSTTTGSDPADWPGARPATISVPLGWTFLLPLVAVDPVAEARLLHLDRAVTQGSYLPTTDVTRGEPVPVIIASSIDEAAEDSITLSRLPASAAARYSTGLSPAHINGLLDTTDGQAIGATGTVTAAQAYRELLGYLRGARGTPVTAYWTPGPAHYATAADGAIMPEPVAADPQVWTYPYALTGQDVATTAAADVGYRALTPHVAVSLTSDATGQVAASSETALQTVGVFDPDQIASSAATPSPYVGERLTAANAISRRLLGGGTLTPDGNPAGYPSPGATLVMPLQDIGAFTATGTYTHTDASAPIGSVRVRVAGVTGDDALSQARVRMVAQEIVRATGLHVDVTLAASAVTRTIDLAAGGAGHPALQLHEIWYRSDTQATLAAGVDPRTVALSAVLLLVGSGFVGSAVPAMTRKRRRELVTLRALGWRRRHLAWRIGQSLLLVAAGAGLLAALAVYFVEATMGARLITPWPLLSVPAALAMMLGTAWLPMRTATVDAVSAGIPAQAPLAGRLVRPTAGRLGLVEMRGRRASWLAALRLLVTVAACGTFGLELAVRYVFDGVIVGSLLGSPVWWQDSPVDVVAVISIVLLAAVVIIDIDWRNGADGPTELHTLRAIGWSAYDVARLAASRALLLGLVGGVVASALDVAGILAIVHRPPTGLAVVPVSVAGLGVMLSLISVTLRAAIERATRALA